MREDFSASVMRSAVEDVYAPAPTRMAFTTETYGFGRMPTLVDSRNRKGASTWPRRLIESGKSVPTSAAPRHRASFASSPRATRGTSRTATAATVIAATVTLVLPMVPASLHRHGGRGP
jgi:hypothetical protein